MATLAPAYAPRRPTETALCGIVRDNLETFLSWARETYAKPLPRYVEQELRAYLRCGVFAHGFVHCRCDDCRHDILVAFSCKQRGACPSCAGRRMANTAAHLVDRVLPDVPVRQYVLSLPFELRALAAFKPEVLRAMARVAYRVKYLSRGRAKHRVMTSIELLARLSALLLSAHSLPRRARAALGLAPRDRSASAGKLGGGHRRDGSDPSLLTRGRRTRPTRGQGDEGPRADRCRR